MLARGRSALDGSACAFVPDPVRSPGFVGGNRRFVPQDVFELVNAFEQTLFGELIDLKTDGRVVGPGQRLTGEIHTDNRARSAQECE